MNRITPGDRVVVVHDEWHSYQGKPWVLERGMHLTCNLRTNFNGVQFLGFEELDEDPYGDPPIFMASGFRPEKLDG